MKGMWTWLQDEKRVISASRPPKIRVIQPPTLDVEQKTYPHRAIAAQPIIHLYW